MLLRRIGLIGDVHAQIENLEIALDFFGNANVEKIICTGDIPDGPHKNPDAVNNCVKRLQENQVATVKGNHDRWTLASEVLDLPDATPLQTLDKNARAFLRGLPSTLAFETHAGKLLLCHGMGANDMQGVKPDDDFHALRWKPELHELIRGREYSYVIAGHTHIRMARRFPRIKGALVVINAGTLLPNSQPCCAIADFAKQQIQFFDIASGEVVNTQILEL